MAAAIQGDTVHTRARYTNRTRDAVENSECLSYLASCPLSLFVLVDAYVHIGAGAYGVVFLGKWRMQEVAVKQVKEAYSREQVEEFKKKAQLYMCVWEIFRQCAYLR